jgi:glycerol-3-phosphate dehydrogenase
MQPTALVSLKATRSAQLLAQPQMGSILCDWTIGKRGGSTMTLRQRAEKAAEAVCQVLDVSPTSGQAKKLAETIEQVVIDAVLKEQERCAAVAMKCCSADRDMAHKIAAEMRQAHIALIANLSGMR